MGRSEAKNFITRGQVKVMKFWNAQVKNFASKWYKRGVEMQIFCLIKS